MPGTICSRDESRSDDGKAQVDGTKGEAAAAHGRKEPRSAGARTARRCSVLYERAAENTKKGTSENEPRPHDQGMCRPRVMVLFCISQDAELSERSIYVRLGSTLLNGKDFSPPLIITGEL